MSEQIVDRTLAKRYTTNYVCAGCWGRLTYDDVEGRRDLIKIRCWNCGDDRGLVTADFVERQRSEDTARFWDAENALRKAGVKLDGDQPAEQLTKELGY